MKENTYSDIYQPANAVYRMFCDISNVCKIYMFISWLKANCPKVKKTKQKTTTLFPSLYSIFKACVWQYSAGFEVPIA